MKAHDFIISDSVARFRVALRLQLLPFPGASFTGRALDPVFHARFHFLVELFIGQVWLLPEKAARLLYYDRQKGFCHRSECQVSKRSVLSRRQLIDDE